MTGARKRSTILPRIVQGRGVRWQGVGVVSRRVHIDTGAQHTWRDNEKREPKVGKTLIRICIPKDNLLPSTESTSQFESKNRSAFSGASLYHMTDKKTSVQRSRRFDECKDCMCPRRRALRGTAPSKKEKSYAHTTTVSFRGDLRADAVG